MTLSQSEHGADFPGETFLALKEQEIKKGSQKVTPRILLGVPDVV
jgi:hypothetical protein